MKKFVFIFFLFFGHLFAEDANGIRAVWDSSANRVAVWQARDPNTLNHVVQGATFIANSTWSAPVTISSSVDQDVNCFPRISIDSLGNVLVAWCCYDNTLGTNMIRSAYLPAVSLGSWGTWSSPVDVSSANENVLNDFTLNIDKTGAFILYWASYLNMSGTSTARTSATPSFNGSWSTPVSLSD